MYAQTGQPYLLDPFEVRLTVQCSSAKLNFRIGLVSIDFLWKLILSNRLPQRIDTFFKEDIEEMHVGIPIQGPDSISWGGTHFCGHKRCRPTTWIGLCG